LLARNLNKRVGDRVEIEGQQLAVIGLYESANLFENSSAIVPLRTLQNLMDREGQVTAFLIRIQESSNKPAMLAPLQNTIEELRDEKTGRKIGVSAMPTEEHIRTNLELRVVKGMSLSTSIIALVIGVIGLMNTSMISVFERTREIGTLRAVGWPRGLVVRMILFEMLVLALLGALMGFVMSFGLTWLLSVFPSTSALMLPSHVSPVLMGETLLLALLGGMTGALYPAYLGARLLPTEALRHE
jgi:putative ABC transport system permease protein